MLAKIATAVLFGMASMPVLAQPPGQPASVGTDARSGPDAGSGAAGPRSSKASNIVPANTRSNVAPVLPSPRMGENAESPDYLKAAYAALSTGRTGLAQQSLEMAETRVLGGATSRGDPTIPGDIRKASRIRDALRALGEGNRKQAIEFVKIAMLN